MKQTRLLVTAGLAAAVVAVASMQPLAQGHQQPVAQHVAGIETDGVVIRIVPPSSEAARIPPELLAELKSVAEP